MSSENEKCTTSSKKSKKSGDKVAKLSTKTFEDKSRKEKEKNGSKSKCFLYHVEMNEVESKDCNSHRLSLLIIVYLQYESYKG